MKGMEMGVADIRPPAGDMLLGDDVLREHRLWLSLSTGEAWMERDASP